MALGADAIAPPGAFDLFEEFDVAAVCWTLDVPECGGVRFLIDPGTMILPFIVGTLLAE